MFRSMVYIYQPLLEYNTVFINLYKVRLRDELGKAQQALLVRCLLGRKGVGTAIFKQHDAKDVGLHSLSRSRGKFDLITAFEVLLWNQLQHFL